MAALVTTLLGPARAQEFTFGPEPMLQALIGPSPLPVGMPAPVFTTRNIDGKPLSLRSLRGKVVLLDYWATWCGPCMMATPSLEALHRQFGKRGLAVVGISLDDPSTVAQVKPFVKHFGVTYRIAAWPQANMKVGRAYHAANLPTQVLIDKKGIVRWSQDGVSMTEKEEVGEMVKILLAEKG
jgi:peroxiredoxin